MLADIKEKHLAYVALGSNLGDKEANLQKAVQLLVEHGVEVVKTSDFLCTDYSSRIFFYCLLCKTPAVTPIYTVFF